MTADDIALTLQKGLGPKGIAHLLETFGDAAAIYAAGADALMARCALREDIARAIAAKATHKAAEEELRYMKRNGISAVASTDSDYPPLLRECPDYPHVLYYIGDAAAFGGRMLAMVGTRNATQYGQRMCDRIVESLAATEPATTIVSGLAYGIDGAAHRAALRCGVCTVAVTALPLPDISPAQHRQLARDIADHGGAIATELHSRTRRNGAYFIPRNRIIAGMCEGCVVVESPQEGGSLSTAMLADGYGRTVMALPGRADDKCSAGTNSLIIRRVAAMVCSGYDIARELGWDITTPGVIPSAAAPQPQLTPDEQALLDCFGNGETLDMDQLTERSGIAAGQMTALLLGLELAGAVRLLPGRRYERS